MHANGHIVGQIQGKHSRTSAQRHPFTGGARRLVTDVDAACDLRRTRRREEAELILDRAKHLPDEERVLLEAVFGAGQSAARVAQLAGREPRSVRREVRRILARVLRREFSFVIGRKESWPGSRRQVASACFVEGLSMRRAAGRLGLTLHTVRRHCEAIRSKAEEALFVERAAVAALRKEVD